MTAHVHLPNHFHVPSVRLPGGDRTAPPAPVIALVVTIVIGAAITMFVVVTLLRIFSFGVASVVAPGPYPVPSPIHAHVESWL